MRPVLEWINGTAWAGMGVSALVAGWAIAREIHRPPAESDGGRTAGVMVPGVWVRVRTAVSVAMAGYMLAERWLGRRIPAWVGLPWLRLRQAVSRGRHAGMVRARRHRGALVVTSHRQGVLTVAEVRARLAVEARAIRAMPLPPSWASLRWAREVRA